MKSKLKIEIPSGANEIIHSLQNNGYEAFLVGGCVRDSILGRPIHDYDITTSATPDEMIEVFNDKRIIETGLQHGTITIVIDGEGYECTTYRVDGNYSDSRRPDSVTFTRSLEEDLKRRDFTINAMAYNNEAGLIDPFNGMEDIKYHKIRCVGKPEDRFSEDALRILRAIRFACQLDFSIHPSIGWVIGYTNIKHNLRSVSSERVQSELIKMILCKSFPIRFMWNHGVFEEIIPEWNYMYLQQNNKYHIYNVAQHSLKAMEYLLPETDLITRFAVLFHDIGKPHCYQDGEDGVRHFKGHGKVSADMTDEIMKRLRFDNDTREKVVELVYYHDSTFEVEKKYVNRWLNKIGEEQFRRLLNVRRADIKAQADMAQETRLQKIDNIEYILEEVLRDDECFSLKDLAVNGKDVMDTMLIKSGKEVGYWLNEILTRVIDGRLKNDREDLIYWMTGITDGWIEY